MSDAAFYFAQAEKAERLANAVGGVADRQALLDLAAEYRAKAHAAAAAGEAPT